MQEESKSHLRRSDSRILCRKDGEGPTQCMRCGARLPERSQAGAPEHDSPLLPRAMRLYHLQAQNSFPCVGLSMSACVKAHESALFTTALHCDYSGHLWSGAGPAARSPGSR